MKNKIKEIVKIFSIYFNPIDTNPALGGITINEDVSVRNAIHVNKVMFGILSHIAVKIENI